MLYIGDSYLGDPVARAAVTERLTTLHRECVQHELTLTPPALTVPAGTHFTILPRVFNQNGHKLFGREMWESSAYDLPADSVHHFYALSPRDTEETIRHVRVWTSQLADSVRVDVPLGAITGASVAERDSSWWVQVAGSNGGLGDPPLGFEQGPSDMWDGSESSCGRLETVTGRTGPGGTSYGTFELHCARLFTLTPSNVTDPFVAGQTAYLRAKYFGVPNLPGVAVNEDGIHALCYGPEKCLAYVIVYGFTDSGEHIATSGPIPVFGPIPSAMTTPARVTLFGR